MKTLAGRRDSHSSAKTTLPKAADIMPNPKGVAMMRRLLDQGIIAAQLKIGSPWDTAEMEANRVADAVVENTGNAIALTEYRASIAPKKGAGPGRDVSPLGSVLNTGTPRRLNTTEQNYFEQRFNRDLGGVRIHEGSAASNAASSINARAFTHGSDIYLKSGEYSFGNCDGKRLMAHELAHTLQPGNGAIRRWGGSEHMAFGDIAGGMVADNYDAYMQAMETISGGSRESALQTTQAREEISEKEHQIRDGADVPTQSITIPYTDSYLLTGVEKQMRLGMATELSGDHRSSADDLADSFFDKDTLDYAGWHRFLRAGYWKYLLLAKTNYNHFFPLADDEWKKNHETAIGEAGLAKSEFDNARQYPEKRGAHISLGNSHLIQALQYEAFGLHFLQDTFASGHQYPRAFDLTQPTEFILKKDTYCDDGTETEVKTVYSFREVQALKEQGWRLIDASDKSTGHKARIYHDLLCELEDGIYLKYREDSQPFHGDNLADSSDYPVAVETYNSMAEVLCTAFSADMATVGARTPEAPSGPDIKKIMEDKLAAPIWYAMEHDLARNFDANAGNDDTTRRTHQTDSGMGVEFTNDSVMAEWTRIHEGSGSVISRDKEKPQGAQFYIDTVGDPDFMFASLDDKIVKYMKENKFPATIPPRQCVYFIKTLLVEGVCGDDDEAAILKILRAQSDNNFFRIVLGAGIEKLDEGIDGSEWSQLLSMISERLENGAASSAIVAELITGLIDTECWDQEEQLILTSLLLLNDADCTKVVEQIGLEKFDSGIDGEEWDQFLSVIMSKLPVGEKGNLGALQIAHDDNDDAARLAVARLWGAGYAVIGRHVSPLDCISLIKTLLSGSCGDDDEDAIVLIVGYMVDTGQKKTINDEIGQDTMDSGVDGAQWTKVACLMGWN